MTSASDFLQISAFLAVERVDAIVRDAQATQETHRHSGNQAYHRIDALAARGNVLSVCAAYLRSCILRKSERRNCHCRQEGRRRRGPALRWRRVSLVTWSD